MRQPLRRCAIAAPEEEFYAPYRDYRDAVRTHTAFVPFWFFGHLGGEASAATLDAAEAVGIHVPVDSPQGLIGSGLAYFGTPGETRVITID